ALVANPEANMRQYGSVGWLFAVVSRIAEGAAAAEWELYRRLRNRDREEVLEHDFLTLWNRPNPFYTREELLETLTQHFALVGEMWIVVLRDTSGRPAELWPVRPDRIAPVPDAEEFIRGYVYKVGADKIPLRREDVISIIRPNPLDPYRGLGVVQTIIADIEGEKAASIWNRNFFTNGALPGGIIELPEGISDSDFEQMVLRWREQHQGVGNAHRVAIIERGKWVERRFSPRDMLLDKVRMGGRDVILGAFGFPRHMLGITEDVNRANADAAEVMFTRHIIRPLLRRIRANMNEELVKPTWGPQFELDFIDPTPEDREQERLDFDSKVNAVGTLVRSGYEPAAVLAALELPEIPHIGLPPVTVQPVGGPTPPPVTDAVEAAVVRAMAKQDPLLPDPLEQAERTMQEGWERRLRREADGIISHLGLTKGRRKVEASDVDGYNWDWWAKYGDDVVDELLRAFSLAFLTQEPDLGPSLAQRAAEEYARHRAGELLRLDGSMSMARQTRDRVRQLVSETIEQGESLQALARRLREDLAFSRSRADMIARTETATALGQGAKQAAIGQGRDQKRWVTQGDDRVEPECRANEAAGWISIKDPFPSGRDTIPQHPRCRCSVRYRTASLHGDAAPALEVKAEVRCPECNRIIAKNMRGTAELQCRHCKLKFMG
ncbi:MAG TPA: phage portal protein, partial [Phycisphaeraceae bacterium]